jgi:hypothetical protein
MLKGTPKLRKHPVYLDHFILVYFLKSITKSINCMYLLILLLIDEWVVSKFRNLSQYTHLHLECGFYVMCGMYICQGF